MAFGTRTKFQLEIPITSTISAIHKFRENILESSWNVSETILDHRQPDSVFRHTYMWEIEDEKT